MHHLAFNVSRAEAGTGACMIVARNSWQYQITSRSWHRQEAAGYCTVAYANLPGDVVACLNQGGVGGREGSHRELGRKLSGVSELMHRVGHPHAQSHR